MASGQEASGAISVFNLAQWSVAESGFSCFVLEHGPHSLGCFLFELLHELGIFYLFHNWWTQQCEW